MIKSAIYSIAGFVQNSKNARKINLLPRQNDGRIKNTAKVRQRGKIMLAFCAPV